MPEHVWAFAILGLTAGILSGMFGIGGGVVLVPGLSVIFGYELQEAMGTSLGVLVMPVTFFAVVAYYRAHELQIGPAVLIMIGLFIGGLMGAQLALNLPDGLLQRAYAVFLLWVSWRFVEPRKLWNAQHNHVVIPIAKEEPPPQVAWPVLLGVGLLAGIASGLFGIGGGIVIVPALVTVLHFPHKQAIGTSLTALLPPVGSGAVLSYYNAGKIELSVVAFIALGLVCGGFIGARIALGLPSTTVKRLYGVFLLVVAMRFMFQL